uniref:Uncharacterized protein n=1 Tax=Oncorhynchus kisutch TaxID=8019 RepID=A0A8C7HM75_ONCKI
MPDGSWLGLAKALSQEEHLKNLGLWEPSEGPRWWTRSCSCRRKRSEVPGTENVKQSKYVTKTNSAICTRTGLPIAPAYT